MPNTAGLVLRLFEALEKEHIRYCLWKTNGIDKALSGVADIDLLLEKSQADRGEVILLKMSFKRVITQPWQRFPGIEDWLGCDTDTGNMIHIHLYYQIWIGIKFVKQLRLPWEDLILQTAVRHPAGKFYTINPELEIIVAAVRAGSEYTYFHLLGNCLNKSAFPHKLLEHYKYLRQTIDHDKAAVFLNRLFAEKYAEKLKRLILNSDLNTRAMIKLKAIAGQALGDCKRYGYFTAILIYASFCAYILWGRLLKKLLQVPFCQKKRFHTAGSLIAIIGCDGAGKTTVTQQLYRWFNWKVDAEKLYLGSGSGLPNGALYLLKRLIMRYFSEKQQERGTDSKATTDLTIIHMFWKAFIARRLYKVIIKAKRECSKGKVILTDRFPQNTYSGIYDGPCRQEQEGRSFLYRALWRYERKNYKRLENLPPDIVVKLLVPAEIALQRKKGEPEEDVIRKAEITAKLSFQGARTIEVDAAKPLEEVLLIIKKRIWPFL